MRYAEYPAGAGLEPWIECFWCLEDAAPRTPAPLERVIPDGCVELIVHLDRPFRRFHATGQGEVQPRCFVVGQLTGLLVLRPTGPVQTWGARFRPAGPFPFFGVGLDALTDAQVPIEALWGAPSRSLPERMAAAPDADRRLAILRDQVRRRLDPRRAPRPETRAAVHRTLAARGRVGVRETSRWLGWSARRLERRFRAEVGVSPKVFARIVRLQEAVRELGNAEAASGAHVAQACGYSDQTHFIRDFSDLTGHTPARHDEHATALTRAFTSSARLQRYFDAAR
jgi:AraC-like DNA-binding protein